MKNLKKILSYLMTIMVGVILFSGVKVNNVLANEILKFKTPYGILGYFINGNEITISYYNGTDRKIEIPSEIDGKSVTRIADCAFESLDLTDVIIPNSVISIGNYTFAECVYLENIKIPSSVTSIGDTAFWRCRCLKNIEVNENNKTFMDENGVLLSKDKTSLIYYPEGKTKNIYSIPNSVKNIGIGAFKNNIYLRNIIIPNSVENIGRNVFDNCINLTDITIPNSVKNIGEYAFNGCLKLKNVIISNALTRIEDGTFYYCNSLENIEVPNSVKSIGYSAFASCAKLTNITIPNSVKSIERYAFNNCINLTISGYKNSYAENYAKEKSIPFKEIEIPITIESFKADKTSPQKIKTAVNLTTKATAKGTEEGILEYKYYRHLKGKYALIKDWSTSNSITIAPQKSGTYDIYVGVRDSKGNIVRKNIEFIFIDNLKIESFKADKTSPQKVQTKVKFTTKGTGEGALEYKYYRYLNEKYALIKDWSTSDSITIAPKTKGIYDIWVGIKDNSGGIVRKNIKFTFN